ncbi:MAG: SIMPL domain-containing protein, partial [Candidatus Eremiobacteraeota bacterium]|nr:SIMPL domain-containing protein [Candidatus Eremiobacteraeota bacterium]
VALTIVSDDDDATRSAGKNTTIYDALEAKLSALGIGKDAVRTTYFNVDFVPHPAKNVPPQDLAPRYGYTTTRSLTVDVAPIETAGKIVDAATRAGVTTIGGVSFDLRDRKSAYHEALIAAMVDAQASAVALVKGGGLHIVRVLRISTSSAERPIRPFAAASFNARMAAPASEPPTDIAPNGPIDVSAHVDVTYEIR